MLEIEFESRTKGTKDEWTENKHTVSSIEEFIRRCAEENIAYNILTVVKIS